MINGERWLIQESATDGPSARHILMPSGNCCPGGLPGIFYSYRPYGAGQPGRLTLWPDIELVSGQRLLKLRTEHY